MLSAVITTLVWACQQRGTLGAGFHAVGSSAISFSLAQDQYLQEKWFQGKDAPELELLISLLLAWSMLTRNFCLWGILALW